jgi:hypothetical protein
MKIEEKIQLVRVKLLKEFYADGIQFLQGQVLNTYPQNGKPTSAEIAKAIEIYTGKPCNIEFTEGVTYEIFDYRLGKLPAFNEN